MQYRRFGRTDVTLSEITFGAMRFVRGSHTDNDPAVGMRALEEALDHGVTTIHSSYEYRTRWAVGEVLATNAGRHEIKHIIKAPVPDYEDRSFDPAKFRKLVEDALGELRAERIAIVQHLQRGVDKTIIYDERGDPERIAALPEIGAALRETFDELRREGKVEALATFPHTPGYAEAAIESGYFDGMIAFFNAIETEMVPFFSMMHDRGMGYVPMRPFYQGLLTDKRADRAALPADDRMRDASFDELYARFDRVRETVGDQVGSWSDLAIKLALADPLFASVIVSMNTAEQVRAVLAAADGNYPDPTLITHLYAAEVGG